MSSSLSSTVTIASASVSVSGSPMSSPVSSQPVPLVAAIHASVQHPSNGNLRNYCPSASSTNSNVSLPNSSSAPTRTGAASQSAVAPPPPPPLSPPPPPPPPPAPQNTALSSPGPGKFSQANSSYPLKTFDSWTSRARTLTQNLVPKPALRRQSTIRVVDNYEPGHPKAAAFISTSEDFQVHRKYIYLHNRLLLSKQAEISQLESKLAHLDARDAVQNPHVLMSYNSELDLHTTEYPGEEKVVSERIKLFERLDILLNSYDDLLFKMQQLLAMNPPSSRARHSVYDYLTTRAEVVEPEIKYIYHKLDLVSLGTSTGMDRALVDEFAECFLRVLGKVPFLHRIFCSSEDKSQAQDPDLHFSTRWRVNLFVAFLITILIVFLLVAPVYALFKVTSHEGLSMTDKVNISVGILISATFVMSLMLSVFTRARRYETLAASAAYCAVLVVFIGNIKGEELK